MIRRVATRTALSARSVASRSRMLPAASHLLGVSSSTAFSSLNMQKTWLSTSSVSVPPPPTSNHPHHKLEGAEGMIIYTETDEAPALATYSLYPVIAKVRLLRLTLTFLKCLTYIRFLTLHYCIHILVWCPGQY